MGNPQMMVVRKPMGILCAAALEAKPDDEDGEGDLKSGEKPLVRSREASF